MGMLYIPRPFTPTRHSASDPAPVYFFPLLKLSFMLGTGSRQVAGKTDGVNGAITKRKHGDAIDQRLASGEGARSWCSHLGLTRLIASGSATGARLSCAFLVQRVVYTMERKPEAIGNAQLVIDLAQIVLDHLLGCTELISDLLVALALRDAGDDRQLFG
jgi:hypothetical protein